MAWRHMGCRGSKAVNRCVVRKPRASPNRSTGTCFGRRRVKPPGSPVPRHHIGNFKSPPDQNNEPQKSRQTSGTSHDSQWSRQSPRNTGLPRLGREFDASGKLSQQMQQLATSWRDQEHVKFSADFEQEMKQLVRLIETSERHVPYLMRKAELIEEYQRGNG